MESDQKSPLDIMADHHRMKIDEKFILKLSKGSKNVSKEVKYSCKILHFSSEWNIEEVLMTIDELDPKEYPQLFIFIVEATNLGYSNEHQQESSTKVGKLQEKLLKFGSDRPMIIQLTSEEENVTKIYYKEETLNYFTAIDHRQDEFEDPNAFRSFLCSYLNGEFNNSEIDVLNAVQEFENCSLILRFLRTLSLSDGFFGALLLDRATKGTKAEFLAILDSPFDCNGRILGNRAQKYISNVFGDDDPENDDSVLLTAIENENTEVIDYLITYWAHLIQQLPIDHQVKISTTAFETNQLNVLCDLLDIADYPFSDDFKIDSVDHARLGKITSARIDFNAAIKVEDFERIDEFIDTNLNQKCIFNPSNNSALTEALNLKKFAVFYYLKSLGFQGEKCDDILAKLSKEEKEQAVKIATDQRKKNVNKSVDVAPKSVMLLSMRSSVHNSRTEKMQALKYREKIMKWFIDIHNVAPELIDVAASCDYLKIIFDFESDSVENVSLTESNASGSTYPVSKWIFVSAKLSDNNGNVTKQREQQIKGVLAHELCHYVMRLVYENQQKPYYKYRQDMKEMFEEIVKRIDKWSAKDSKRPNDECNGIISSVFTLYPSKDFHPELIVRVVQILSEFDNSEEKSKHLEEKYNILYEFWHIFVIPELRTYLQRNQEVIRLNETFGLLPSFTNLKYELHYMNKGEKLINNNKVVVQTNAPKFLFLNILEHLQQKSGNLFDSQNIFVDPEKLKNKKLFDKLKQICSDNQEVRMIIDCTKKVPEFLGEIFRKKDTSIIFVVSNQQQSEELAKIFNKKAIKLYTILEINYNWSDLTEESQKLMLETKINFQNNSQITILDLLKVKESPGNDAVLNLGRDILLNMSEIVDDQLLNLMISKKEITIKATKELNSNEKYFEQLNKQGKFLRKENISYFQSEQESEDITKIFQEELLSEAKNKKFFLISDQAGNGNSWAMKNFTKILCEKNPTSWVTYVDLKQFVDAFKAQEREPEFSSFMIKKILKFGHKFESKIFQKLYKNGKVFIIFDEFDEISPDCAEFVSKLAQNFKFNGGNQLWIATRDYFEVDLQEKLQLVVSYGLDEMYNSDGTNMIEEFNQLINDSSDFEKYKGKSKQIVDKVQINRDHSIELPQMYKMIANGFKYTEYINNLTKSKIYMKFIKNLYKRWSKEKGLIRKQAFIKSQQLELYLRQIHQFHAIASLFPALIKILFPGYNGSKLSVEEVIACGLMGFKDGKIYFLHETVREFFVADALAKALKNDNIKKKVVEILAKVPKIREFKIIIMFLNGRINDCLEGYKMKHFADYFTTNKKTLEDFVLEMLKNRNHEDVKKLNLYVVNKENLKILWTEVEKYFSNQNLKQDFKEFVKQQDEWNKNIAWCENVEAHESLWTFLLKTFEDQEELKDFMLQKDNNFIHEILNLNINPDIVAFTLQELNENLSESDYQEILKSKGCFGRNSIQAAAVNSKEVKTHQSLWKTLRDSCKSDEEFLDILDENAQNIFYLAASFTTEVFEFMEKELEKVAPRFEIKKLLNKQNQNKQQNLLHLAAGWSKSLEIHKILWKTYEKYFEPSEILELIKQIDTNGNNFLFAAVEANTKEIVEFTWKKLKCFLVHNEQIEYLKIKVNNDDLLTVAFRNKRHQDVYDFIKNLLNSFEEMLKYENADLDADMEICIDISDIEEGNYELKLIEAVKENNLEKVKEIIKYVIDINKQDENQMMAIDYAWMNFINFKNYYERSSQISDEILLLLLNANSKFPSWRVGFDNKEASTGVHNFVDLCEGMHRDVVNGKVNHILQVINKHPNLRYFHDRNNETLLLLTLKKQSFEILKILDGRVSIREDESLKEIYYESFMGIDEESNLDEPKLPPAHILLLQAKSRVINCKNNNNKHFEYISNAFKSINEIKSCSTILKVAALLKDLKIIFDFSRNSFNDIKYESGNIYIGAKELMDVKEKNNVIGTLIHELCHLAVSLTYMNNFNPYPEGKSEKYEIIFNKINQNYIKLDDIVVQTFTHKEEKQHAELIVRPLQILVHHRENAAKINQFQAKYSDLFDFVRDIVIPDMEKALAVHKILQHENKYITFEDLTEPMKVKILNSEIIFQGEKSTIFDLFGDNEKIINSLSSEDIRRILFKNECLIIGTELKFDTYHCDVDKKFIQFGNATENRKEIKEKTSTFKDFVTALKKANKSSWISMINLKDVHDDFRTVNKNIVNVMKILLKILKINAKTEVSFFINLYESDKVIILLDGFDEITPEYSEQWLVVLKKMNETSRNQIWISTKIHNDQHGYQFAPIAKNEKIKSIGKRTEVSLGSDGIDCINDSINSIFRREHVEHRAIKKRKLLKNEKLIN